MNIDDDGALAALAELAMDQGARAKIKFTNIAPGQAGQVDVRFTVRSSGERLGLLAPLPSSIDSAPWMTESTTTSKKWALAFYWWLVGEAEAEHFASTLRTSYLQLNHDGFLMLDPGLPPSN